MNSSRNYTVTGFEAGCLLTQDLSLEQLLTEDENDYEFMYALQMETDAILDLKVGETMNVSFSRGDVYSKGVIIRTS